MKLEIASRVQIDFERPWLPPNAIMCLLSILFLESTSFRLQNSSIHEKPSRG
jgi:hypothetical protein